MKSKTVKPIREHPRAMPLPVEEEERSPGKGEVAKKRRGHQLLSCLQSVITVKLLNYYAGFYKL